MNCLLDKVHFPSEHRGSASGWWLSDGINECSRVSYHGVYPTMKHVLFCWLPQAVHPG